MATKIAFFDTKSYDRETFNKVNLQFGFDITYFKNNCTYWFFSNKAFIIMLLSDCNFLYYVFLFYYFLHSVYVFYI